MQHVLLEFGLCHLVVLDNDILFKGIFSTICEILHLNHDFLAKRNNKDFTVEHFHHFLNKSVTITAEERDTNNIFCSCWRRSHCKT